MPNIQLFGKVRLEGVIRAKTGLHIGGGQARIDIGGLDHIVIKDPDGRPYIPGSSLKGKLRSLLEIEKGLAVDTERVETRSGETVISMHLCNKERCPVCLLFGRHNDKFLKRPPGARHECSLIGATEDKQCPKDNPPDGANTQACPYLCIDKTTPTRLLVRDASLQEASITDEMRETLTNRWTEEKMENSIDRITSAANPRQLERVPKGALFTFEIVFTLLEEGDEQLLADLILAMQLLEDDYLGAWGSRGSGQVCFEDMRVFWHSLQDYRNGATDQDQSLLSSAPDLRNLRARQETVVETLGKDTHAA